MSDSPDSAGAARRYQLRPRHRIAWRKWPRRLLVLASVVALHQWWCQRAEQRFDRELLSLAAAGEPVSVGQLLAPPVPDEQNAALDLRAAAESLKPSVDSDALRSVFDGEPEPPLTDDEKCRIARLLYDHADALDRVRAARAKRDVRWPVTIASPLYRTEIPDLNKQLNLVWLLEFSALYEHERGDDAAALERLRDMLFVSRAVGRGPFLCSAMTSRGIAEQAATRLAQIAPTLRASPDGAEGAATPKQLAAAVGEFLDDAAHREALRTGLRWDRLQLMDLSDALADGRLAPRDLLVRCTMSSAPPPSAFERAVERCFDRMFDASFPVLGRGLIRDDEAIIVRHATAVMRAADLPTWPAVRRQVSDRPPEMQGSVWNVVRHPCAGLLLPRYDVELQRHFECASARRLAATVLAVRWYACDHGGQLPARLDDLVPAYLPSVPADPFAETNAPIRYLNHPARPAVYSVGENGVDNGGCEPDRKLSWSERRKVADDVRYLRPRPRKPVPPPVVFPPFLSLQPPSE